MAFNKSIAKSFRGVEIQLVIPDHIGDVGDQTKEDLANIFLQRLLPINLSTIPLHQPTPSAFLDGRARIIAVFYLFKKSDQGVYLWVSQEYAKAAGDHLESMRFSDEDPEIKFKEKHWIEIRHEGFFQTNHKTYPLPDWQIDDRVIKGQIIAFDTDSFKDSAIESFKAILDADLFEALACRGESPGIDAPFFRDLMVLDGPFDHFLSRDSGCYPGQEVVEKIYSIGRRPKKMLCFGVVGIDRRSDLETSQNILFEGKKIGKTLCVNLLRIDQIFKNPLCWPGFKTGGLKGQNQQRQNQKGDWVGIGLAVVRNLPKWPLDMEMTLEMSGHRLSL